MKQVSKATKFATGLNFLCELRHFFASLQVRPVTRPTIRLKVGVQLKGNTHDQMANFNSTANHNDWTF